MNTKHPVPKRTTRPGPIVTGLPITSQSVRAQMRALLAASPGYGALPAARRKEVADDTVRVAAYLADPHRLLSREFRSPLLANLVSSGTAGRTRKAQNAARDSAAESLHLLAVRWDALVAAVDFPGFVAGLIQGVFGAIVDASIEQMDAYAALISDVAKTVDRFVEDQITDESARDSLADAFPQAVCLGGGTTRRLTVCAAPGSPALAALERAVGLREPLADPRHSADVKRLVEATRRRLARNRQQLLATMVLMGISRTWASPARARPRS